MFAPVVGYNTVVSQGAVSTWSTTNFANLVAHSRLTNRQVQRWWKKTHILTSYVSYSIQNDLIVNILIPKRARALSVIIHWSHTFCLRLHSYTALEKIYLICLRGLWTCVKEILLNLKVTTDCNPLRYKTESYVLMDQHWASRQRDSPSHRHVHAQTHIAACLGPSCLDGCGEVLLLMLGDKIFPSPLASSTAPTTRELQCTKYSL
jgi:hypothetical protein